MGLGGEKMRSATLVDATDLRVWALRRDAQGLLPQFVRRLIHATVKRVFRAGFPAGEGVQLGGWDGIVAVDHGNAFVPDGTSAWELGTNSDVKRKADADYEKRCQDPRGIDPAQSTFVFVTLRRWSAKDEWIASRRSEGVWREVRMYDADDLEQWLELAPTVHIWLSILLGKHPEGAMDLGSHWSDWSATTRPVMTPEFVLSGRSDVVESVHLWLRDPLEPRALKAESRDEAIAVFAAAVQQLPLDERIVHLSRAVVVTDLASWHRLTASTEPLILVLAFDSPDAVARATRTGHRVVIPLSRADSTSAKTIIPRLSKEEATKILVASGIPEDRARDLAALARTSLMSFRRKLAVVPGVHQPEWARPAEARPLLPALLAGAWAEDENKWSDRRVIAMLARASYEQVQETLVRWSQEADAPVRHVGDAWFIVSKDDAWSLLARYLTRDDLERFESAVIDVLGTPDPRYNLPALQRWMAGALGHAPRHSSLLREGLADTLAVMGARGAAISVSAGVSARDYARRIARRLLALANADWRVWASLSSSLPLLAEAAPDAFLSAVEEGLAGTEPVLANLFAGGQQNPLFDDAPHTGLLWALETLAWSPEHLGHVAFVLARLARLDPGGRRPQHSLRSIFLLWHPQTTATLDQRLAVLDMLREREPDVLWRLLRQLTPESLEIGHNAPTPRWREWTPDSPQTVSQGEYVRGGHEVAARMLAIVGESGPRWQGFIEVVPMLPEDTREVGVERLATMDVERLLPPDRAAIWNTLRELISKHRSFPDADWALPKEYVDRLDTILRRFEPKETATRYGWLFGNSPDLPEGRVGDWRANQDALEKARLDAVRTIQMQAGLPGVLELLGSVERPSELGFTLGRSDLASAEEDELLRENLSGEDTARARFARGFAYGRVSSRGREWAKEKLAGVAMAWSPAHRAELLACLPNDAPTWGLAEASDKETEHRYWRLVVPYGIANADAERAARKLLEHGRPYAAVDLLAFHAKRDASLAVLAADALEQVLRTSPEDDPPPASFSHDVSELLDVLAQSKGIDEHRIARLEWAFLSVLGTFVRPPKLLHRELARTPDLFIEIIALIYRAEGEEPRELTPEEKARVQRGYELLDSSRTVPGTAEDGTIDTDALRQWVKRAREATGAIGRQAIADERIGRVLSAAPRGPDGTWPHPAVRDVIQEIASADLERGVEIGVYNSRGTVRKGATEGGAQERQLAEQYVGFAAAITDRWPRMAAVLRRITDTYLAEALREDQRAQLRQDINKW